MDPRVIQNALSKIGQVASGFFNQSPPLRSPLPQPPALASPNYSLGTRINNALPQLPDIGQALNNIPTFQLPKFQTQSPVFNTVANLPSNLVEGVINQPKQSLQAANRIGTDIVNGTGTPQRYLGNAAEAALLPLTFVGGPSAVNSVGKAALETGFGQAVKQGAISGAKFGAGQGFLTGLASNRDATTLPNQLLGSVPQAIGGAVGGAVIGGAASGLTHIPVEAFRDVTYAIKSRFPQLSPQQSTQVAQTFLRDEMGRFAKGVTQKPEPVYYGDIRESLGLPRNGDYSQGFARIPGTLNSTGKEGLRVSPQAVQKAGQRLSQEASQGQSQIPLSAEALTGNVPQNLTKVEAKKVAANLGLQGKEPTIPIGEKPLGVVKTINESTQTTPGLQMKGDYNVAGNKQTLAAATNRIATDPNGAYQFALNTHSAEGNATAVLLAKQYESAGQPQMAANLMIEKAKQALQAGQGNQVYSLWDKLSPETVAKTAQSTIERYNATAKNKIPALTTEQYQNFVKQASAIQGMTDAKQKGMATQQLLQDIGRLIPSSNSDKGIALWRAGLLTGFRTPGKIIVSHLVSNTFEQAKNIPAAGVDITSSMLTGKRSLTPTLQGNVTGFRKGISAGVDNFLHGYEAPNSGGMTKDFTNQVNFGNSLFGKVAQQYVDRISRLHGSLYKPFFGAAHLNSLYDQALTEAGNQGLKGDALNNFVENFVKSPPPAVAQRALQEAEYTTFQNKTALGTMIGGVKSNKGVAGKIAQIVAPFSQIPSSIAMKLVDYSPAGAVKTIIENIGKGNFDQRAFSQGLGRSITGTSLAAIGGALYAKGLMTLNYPTDKDEQALWKATGKVENAININGSWHQLGSLGPTGSVLAMGGHFVEGLKKSGVMGGIGQAGSGAANELLNLPYLQGIQTILATLQDPGNKGLAAVKNYAGSLVPTGVANIATALDPLQRQTNTVTDAITNKIPGLREQNLPAYDALGQNIPRAQGAVGSLVDPFYSSTDRSTPLTTELQRLLDSGNSVGLQPLTKNQTIYGQKQTLNPQQLTQAMQTLGPQIQQQLNMTIADPAYQQLDDKQKSTILSNIISGTKNSDYNLQRILNSPQSINNNPVSSVLLPSQANPQLDKYHLQMAKDQLTNSSNNSLDLGNGVYLIKDPNTGSIKQVSISQPITRPALTGSPALDKIATSKYNSAVSTRANDIYSLYQAGQMTQSQASQAIQQLNSQKVSRGRKLRVSKRKAPKVKLSSLKKIPTKKVKLTSISSQPKGAQNAKKVQLQLKGV